MTSLWRKLTETWPDGVSLILGIWLFMSPWKLGFVSTDVALWNAVIVGLAIVLMAIMALFEFHDWEEWVDMAVGLWLVVSPWVLGFVKSTALDHNVVWNFVAVGVLTFGMAAWSLRDHHQRAAA